MVLAGMLKLNQPRLQRQFATSCRSAYPFKAPPPAADAPPRRGRPPKLSDPPSPGRQRGRPKKILAPSSDASANHAVFLGRNECFASAVSNEDGVQALPGLLNHPASPTEPLELSPSPRWITGGSGGKVDLPPVSQWRKHFNLTHHAIRERVCVRNPVTADALADAFVPSGSQGKVIVEAFPGPGALTRSLLVLPKSRIHKLIVLENHEPYLEYLRPLAQLDPRLHVVPMDACAWDTYQTIWDQGLLDDVSSMPWDAGAHEKLQFIGHLPHNIMGEQLIAQLFRGIPEKSWLFKYGRVPLNFVLSEWVWDRINARPVDPPRCKLSIIAQATAQLSEALPRSMLQPYDDHFHPTVSKTGPWSSIPENRRAGTPFAAIKITPSKEQVIEPGTLDQWDYCLRRLFVLKSQPLKSAISHLAPGAATLLKGLSHSRSSRRFDINTPVRELSIGEWAQLLRAFDEWPFAPEDLSISDSFTRDDRKA